MSVSPVSERAARAALSRFRTAESVAADLTALGPVETWHKAVRADRSGTMARVIPNDRLESDRQYARFLTPGDSEWPAVLDSWGPLRPLGLWVRGSHDPAALTADAVAVLGNRHPSPYGRPEGERIARELASLGRTVVTTTSSGVDIAALGAASEQGGRPVAVMPRGLDRLFPDSHPALNDHVYRGGTLISLAPPGVEASSNGLRAASALAAALAAAAVIVEADATDHCLHAAATAQELGRLLLAMTSNGHPLTRTGSTDLLRTGSAQLIATGVDVLAALEPGQHGVACATCASDQVVFTVRDWAVCQDCGHGQMQGEAAICPEFCEVCAESALKESPRSR